MEISFMDIKINSFFEFPGILITIGAVLLVISIILIIIAYRSMGEGAPVVALSDDISSQPSIDDTNDTNNVETDKAIENEDKDIKDEFWNNNGIDSEPNKDVDDKKELELAEKEQQEEEKDEDDGFDLTKVFEVSPLKDEPTFDALDKSIEKDEVDKVTEDDEDEDIELL